MQEWTFYKNRCHPGVANGAVFLKGRQGRRTWASEPLRVRTVWKTIQYRRGTDARGGPRKRCVHTHTYVCVCVHVSKRVYATRVYTAPALANATYVRGARKRLEKGRMWSRRRRESRWRRSLVQPSSILHKVRWEISINRFRRGLSIGAGREPCIRLRERRGSPFREKRSLKGEPS